MEIIFPSSTFNSRGQALDGRIAAQYIRRYCLAALNSAISEESMAERPSRPYYDDQVLGEDMDFTLMSVEAYDKLQTGA